MGLISLLDLPTIQGKRKLWIFTVVAIFVGLGLAFWLAPEDWSWWQTSIAGALSGFGVAFIIVANRAIGAYDEADDNEQ